MTSAADSDKPRAPGFGLANARILLQQARACGIDDQVMLSQTGLSRSQIDLGLVDVTMDQELAMIEALHTNGEESLALGFATGLRYQLVTLGVLGMAIVSSRDVRAALDMIRRYLASSANLSRVLFEFQRDELRLVFSCRYPLSEALERFVIGREFGILAALQGELLGAAPRNVRALSLTFPRLPAMAQMEAVFGCEVTDSAAENCFFGDAAHLQLRMPMQNPVAAVACEELCTGRPAAKQESISHQVRRLITQMLPDVPDMTSVAGSLCMSSRTLSRRLETDGWRWRDLVSECRLSRAEECLRGGDSIKNAALKAGFSSASSFSHAFNRARGVSPRHFCEAPD